MATVLTKQRRDWGLGLGGQGSKLNKEETWTYMDTHMGVHMHSIILHCEHTYICDLREPPGYVVCGSAVHVQHPCVLAQVRRVCIRSTCLNDRIRTPFWKDKRSNAVPTRPAGPYHPN